MDKCSNSRFVNTKCKALILKDLEKEYINTKNDNENDGLDISLVPFLKEFNAIKGIVTLQSCAGHSYKYKGGRRVHNAYLWIWPSKKMAMKFREKAPILAKSLSKKLLMESVTIYYTSWGQEIISISFDYIKEEKGHHNEAKETILAFFRNLAKMKK